MALTIPKAGVVAGQSASLAGAVGLAAGAAAETSGVIAEFGQRMQAHGLQWKAQQRQQQTRKAELDITRDLGQARLEVEQIADPAEMGLAWDARVAEINAKYITTDTDPEVAAALKLSMQGLGDRHALALGEKAINLTRSQQEAAWIEMRQVLTTDATRADPETFGALLELGEAAIDDRIAQGLIDPAAGAAEKVKLREEVWSNRARVAIEDDPAAFLVAADAGTYDQLGGDRLVTYKQAAQTEIDRRAAAEAKASEADAKVRSDAIGTRLDAIADLALKGRLVEDETFLSDPEVAAHPKAAKAVAAVALRKEIPDLDMKTPADLDALIASEEKRPVREPWENERLTILRAMRDKKSSGYGTDAKKTAGASGLPAPDLPDFDPSDPAPWIKGLAQSISFSDWLQDGNYSKRSAIFTAEQKAVVKPILDPKAEAGPKVALMSAILEGSGGNAAPVLAELEADPVFRRGLKVLALTGDTHLTESILRGQQRIEGQTVIVPPRKEQILIFDQMTGGVFADNPALRAEMMDASLALYADGAGGIDGETTASEGWIKDGAAYTLYQQSVQRLLGAQPDRNGALTVGGLQEVNGGLVVLPPGLSVEDAETGWDDIVTRLEGAAWQPERDLEAGGYWNYDGLDSGGTEMDARLAPFKAASIFGGVPDLGSNPASAMAGLSLRRVGESDVYELVYEQSGRLVPVTQAGTDHAFWFRLPDLLRGVRQ